MTLGELITAVLKTKKPSGQTFSFDDEVNIEGDNGYFNVEGVGTIGNVLVLEPE